MSDTLPTTLQVSVVTPRGPVLNVSSDAITAPGEMGEFEVLPGHVPFLTKLHPGVLVVGENTQKLVMAVGNGFLSVSQTGSVQVLVEQAAKLDTIDRSSAEKVVAELGPKIANWKDTTDASFITENARLEWAQAQLSALSRH